MSTPEWATRPERGSEWLLKLMFRIAMLIGRRAAGFFLYPIAAYFWITTGAARRDSKSYLARVLGRPPNWRESYQHYLTFSITILDRFYFLSGRAEEFTIDFHGEEAVLETLAEGRGAFLVGAHLGSFEALRMLARQRPHLRVGMAMFEENAQKIRRLLTAIDPTLLDDVVPLGHMDSMIRIQERLERGDMVGFLADRSFGHDANLAIDFLGQAAQFPTGVFRMACLLKQPVIFMTGLYRGGNRYDVRFDRVIDYSSVERAGRSLMVEQGVKEFAARIEAHCRLAPYNWFNFYDFWAPPTKESKG